MNLCVPRLRTVSLGAENKSESGFFLMNNIPLAQEPEFIRFPFLTNNIPMTQEVEMNRCLPRLRAVSS